MSNKLRDNRLRSLIAQECAKIMAIEGVKDFKLAKRKASIRLGVANRSAMPSNVEIEQAVLEYQRLFDQDNAGELHDRRAAAERVMIFLERFQAQLVGAVLRGIVSPHPEVQLHAFADAPEEILLYLMEHGIQFETSERRLRLSKGGYGTYPVAVFSDEGGITIEVIIFNRSDFYEAPLSPVDGKPMSRAGLARVRGLLAGYGGTPN